MNNSRVLQLSFASLLVLIPAGGSSAPDQEPGTQAGVNEMALHVASADGVSLKLPHGADGPFYDSDDHYRARPTWEGPNWLVHFVFGNGGLTQFMRDGRCLSLNDEQMIRKICIGNYIRYGAMADISRIDTPGRITSMQVSIAPGGLSEAEALSIIRSAVTNWELH